MELQGVLSREEVPTTRDCVVLFCQNSSTITLFSKVSSLVLEVFEVEVLEACQVATKAAPYSTLATSPKPLS